MKRNIIVCCLLFPLILLGQQNEYPNILEHPSVTNMDDAIPMDDSLKKVYLKKVNSEDFFSKMLVFSELSWVAPPYFYRTNNLNDELQKKPFLLTADIRTPIPIGGKSMGKNVIHMIPRYKVRIFQNDDKFNDKSYPVRTPSYIPEIQYLRVLRWNKSNKDNHYAFLSLFHHSNGQDGAEIIDNEINIYNGNFGEDIVYEIGYGGILQFGFKREPTYIQRLDKPKKIFDNDTYPSRVKEYSAMKYYLHWKTSIEWHPKNRSNAIFREDNLYGRKRLNIHLSYLQIPSYRELRYSKINQKYHTVNNFQTLERFRVVLNYSHILDNNFRSSISATENLKKFHFRRINFDLTSYFRLLNTSYSSLFTRVGFYGSDPYNIYFNQSKWVIGGGLAFGFLYSKAK